MDPLGMPPSSQNSQESVDYVPESPPIHTQEDDDDEEDDDETPPRHDDVEAQLVENSSAGRFSNVSVSYDNENVARNPGPSSDRKSAKANFDVIIDIEEGESQESGTVETVGESGTRAFLEEEAQEEFPEEDDAFLLASAKAAEDAEGVTDEPSSQEIPIEEYSLVTDTLQLDEETKAREEANKAEIGTFRRFKPLEKIFPDVRCSEYNTVGFNISPNYKPGDPLKPHPVRFVSKWDSKYVRMPCCDENVALVRKPRYTHTQNEAGVSNQQQAERTPDEDGSSIRKISVWERISDGLNSIPIERTEDFVHVVVRCSRFRMPELRALTYCLEQIMIDAERHHFFSIVVPVMKRLVLRLPEIVTCPLPILRKNVNHNISLTQEQVACLLANAFFSTFPVGSNEGEMPTINFKELFACADKDEKRLAMKAHKIRCLIHYFWRIADGMPGGVVTYSRKNLRHSNMPEWETIDKGLCKLVPIIEGTIEDDGQGMLQVDFANKFIGGGVLGRGAVQEEILFVIYPELLLTRLFTEKLNSCESVIVTGCERFSRYKGYSLNFTFDGDYCDTTPYDSKGRRCTQIVAIDALYVSRPTFQFHPKHICRELNKAYVGFSSPTNSSVAVATGKWGCGAFNGDPHLKAIIQLLAASHAGRQVAFFTFGDVQCFNDVTEICDSVRDMKIKDVYKLLGQYYSLCCPTSKISRPLKDFAKQYAAGQIWEKEKAQTTPAESSIAQSSKCEPSGGQTLMTKFYQPVKPIDILDQPDDVETLTKSMHKISSNPDLTNSSNSGKRQRENSETELSEVEIQRLLQDNEDCSDKKETGREDSRQKTNNEAVTPTSPKRAKRLHDFYLEK